MLTQQLGSRSDNRSLSKIHSLSKLSARRFRWIVEGRFRDVRRFPGRERRDWYHLLSPQSFQRLERLTLVLKVHDGT
jgi:hypothetical protein